MPATPNFGPGDSTDLDVGQPGGALATANSARFSANVLRHGDEVNAVDQPVIHQNSVFRTVLGFRGATVAWEGLLRCFGANQAAAAAVLSTIENNLNARKHGATRSYTTGLMGAPSVTLIKPTKLTDSYGRVISANAVIEDWRFTDRLYRATGDSGFTIMTRLRIEFRILA